MGRETLETAGRLRQSLARLNRRLRTESKVLGLSATKHSILGQLYRDGPKTPKAIAAAEGVQPQSVTRVLAELEESGWVLRAQDELDRRQSNLEITSEGRQLIIQDAKNRASLLASAMDARLSVLEKDLLRLSIQLLDKLAEAVLSDQKDSAAT